MPSWSLRLRRALFHVMSALLLAGMLGHGHMHEDEVVFQQDSAPGSMVKEHCSVCHLLSMPAEPLSFALPAVLVGTRDVRAVLGKEEVASGEEEGVSVRGPPART